MNLESYPVAVDTSELDEEKLNELEGLSSRYSLVFQEVGLFIENNGMDYDEVWDFVNQYHDMAMSYAPNEG